MRNAVGPFASLNEIFAAPDHWLIARKISDRRDPGGNCGVGVAPVRSLLQPIALRYLALLSQ